MWAKACGSDEEGVLHITVFQKQQGCYHALTCLQNRGGSQICGGTAANSVFQYEAWGLCCRGSDHKGPFRYKPH